MRKWIFLFPFQFQFHSFFFREWKTQKPDIPQTSDRHWRRLKSTPFRLRQLTRHVDGRRGNLDQSTVYCIHWLDQQVNKKKENYLTISSAVIWRRENWPSRIFEQTSLMECYWFISWNYFRNRCVSELYYDNSFAQKLAVKWDPNPSSRFGYRRSNIWSFEKNPMYTEPALGSSISANDDASQAGQHFRRRSGW